MIFKKNPWVRLQYDPDLSKYTEHGSTWANRLILRNIFFSNIFGVFFFQIFFKFFIY